MKQLKFTAKIKMKRYFTKTGIELKLVSDQDVLNTENEVEFITKRDEAIQHASVIQSNAIRNSLFDQMQEIIDLLDDREWNKFWRKNMQDYREKAIFVKQLSKNQKVHDLCDQLIIFYNENVAS